MKIMVVGSGGREHALVWKLSLSPRVSEIICVPGNGGIAEIARCIPMNVENIGGLLDLAVKECVDLTVVGPEVSLTLGIVDEFEKKGLKIFGSSKRATILESSKVFMKDFLHKYNISTANYVCFTDLIKAKKYIEKMNKPLVVKADGLAAGKGVLICSKKKDALDAVDIMIGRQEFGEVGRKIVIEEFLEGEEVSFMILSDGKSIISMATSQDYKRIFDDDKGLNTGGMGAYSPVPIVTKEIHDKIIKEIIMPTIEGMRKEGRIYKGVLFGGLMLHNGGIKVLEFNCRFGDPETQSVLVRLKTDLLEVLEASVGGYLSEIELEWKEEKSVCVVMASKGYPEKYQKGQSIVVLDSVKKCESIFVFHAGTIKKDKELIVNGGRVFGVTTLGDTFEKAVKKAYFAAEQINFNKSYFRKDIGYKVINVKEV